MRRVLTDPAYLQRSAAVSKVLRIRPEPPAEQAAKLIEEAIVVAQAMEEFRHASPGPSEPVTPLQKYQ